MNSDSPDSKNLKLIRKRAEKMVTEKPPSFPDGTEDIQKLVHELQVREVELQIQNEELYRVRSILEDSRDRYADLYDFAPAGYFTIGSDDIIIEANTKAARILQTEIRNLFGRRFSVFVADNYKKIYQDALTEVITLNSSSSIEIKLIRSDNSEFWAHMECIAIKRNNGALNEMRTSIIDINQHKADEEALRLSEERFRRIVETANEGIWVVDQDGNLSYLNQRLAEMLGYNASELIGQSVFNLVFDEDRNLIEQKFERKKRGIKEKYDFRLRRKDGNELWVIISSNPILDDKGQFVSALSMLTDITDRIKSERARFQSEQKLGMALEGADIGLWDWDYKTSRINYDPRFARMVGYEPEDVNPFTFEAWKSYVHPDDWIELRAAFEIHYKHKSPHYETGIRIRSKSGEWDWFFIRGKIIERDKKGNPLRVSGTIMNITERRAEARQKARYALLNALRTADCVNSCLAMGCQAVYDGQLFKQALFTLNDDKGAVVNLGYYDLPEYLIAEIDRAVAPDKSLLKRMALDDYRISQSFFIPEDAGIDFAGTTLGLPNSGLHNGLETSWRGGDILCVPTGQGPHKYEGWLVVTLPFNNRRPSTDVVEGLEEIVEIVITRVREIRLRDQLTKEQETLKEKNIALKEVLSSIEAEKTDLRKQISRVITDVLIPASKKMLRKNGTLNKSYYNLLQSNLQELASASSRSLPLTYRLSPRELEIASMIKNGSSSKEIAEALDIALVTVLKHREVIRKKLGLTNKAINLTTHLRNL